MTDRPTMADWFSTSTTDHREQAGLKDVRVFSHPYIDDPDVAPHMLSGSFDVCRWSCLPQA